MKYRYGWIVSTEIDREASHRKQACQSHSRLTLSLASNLAVDAQNSGTRAAKEWSRTFEFFMSETTYHWPARNHGVLPGRRVSYAPTITFGSW